MLCSASSHIPMQARDPFLHCLRLYVGPGMHAHQGVVACPHPNNGRWHHRRRRHAMRPTRAAGRSVGVYGSSCLLVGRLPARTASSASRCRSSHPRTHLLGYFISDHPQPIG
jgi:hypothetical protein